MKQPFRPDYQRVRRFLAKGGALQREVIETGAVNVIYWHTAQRDGRFFDADTCEWLRMKEAFRLDLSRCRLREGRPWIYQLEYLPDTDL